MSEGDAPKEGPKHNPLGEGANGGVNRLPEIDGSRSKVLRQQIVAKILRKPALTAEELASGSRDGNN